MKRPARESMADAAPDPRSPEELAAAGCKCQIGCSACGWSLDGMGNCSAAGPCPAGRAPSAECPIREPDHRLGAVSA